MRIPTIPLPPPDRLIPRPWRPLSGGGGDDKGAQLLLTIAYAPMVLLGPIAAGALAAAYSGWLAVPAGLLAFGIVMTILETTIGRGIVVMIVYPIFASATVQSGWYAPHRDTAAAAVTFAIALAVTVAAWRQTR